jgi:DNA-binding IclR family transcriptional regulator
MPLFRGAASRVILAHLPGPAVARLRARHGAEFAEAGLGATPAAVRAALLAIRRRGWDRTEGQVTPGVTGIAAPVLDSTGAVTASLSLTLGRPQLDEATAEAIAGRVRAAVQALTL